MTPIVSSSAAKVLVVDDNEHNRALAQALLTNAGYSVLLAESGEHGLVRFEVDSPDLVLLDVMMPGLDGFETCRRMRAMPSGASVPVVFLTSLLDLETHKEALAAGADDFLSKPIQRTELLLRVCSLLRIKQLNDAQARNHELIRSQRDRLAEAERQREQTTALIVHDMKNPLAAILANADYLTSTKNLDQDQLDCTRDILSSSRKLTRMVMNLLDVSGSEFGGIGLNITNVDLRLLVDEVLREMVRRLADRDQKLIVTQLPEPPIVRADAEILTRVVANLVENAMKYSPSGGEIELAASVEPDGGFKLFVRDRGPGVPADHRQRIFERFVRLDETSDNTRSSRGLGLASCRVAVEAQGGTIWVEDNQPQGTIFVAKLPKL